MTLPFTSILREIGETVRQILPNPQAQADFAIRMAELSDQAAAREAELLQGQVEVNKEEAKSSRLFVAGWRPFIGWTGGVALIYSFIVGPLIEQLFHFTMPALDLGPMLGLVATMLGVAGLRTVEKTRGVATSIGDRVLTPPRPTPSESISTESQGKEERDPLDPRWFT